MKNHIKTIKTLTQPVLEKDNSIIEYLKEIKKEYDYPIYYTHPEQIEERKKYFESEPLYVFLNNQIISCDISSETCDSNVLDDYLRLEFDSFQSLPNSSTFEFLIAYLFHKQVQLVEIEKHYLEDGFFCHEDFLFVSDVVYLILLENYL